MAEEKALAERFEVHRPHLAALAYRMLGSLEESDDAVQETWIRASRAGPDGVENLGAWLTTIVARVCLNMLRSRRVRREEPIGVHLPDPIISPEDEYQPEAAVVLAESVGLALLIVLDTLSPAERLAFVLHDMFGVPFDQIAVMVPTTPAAARQLASRARRRVREAALPTPDPDYARQREVVSAFFAAARAGSFQALVSLLHPDAVLRSDAAAVRPDAAVVLRGAEVVAKQAVLYALPNAVVHPVRINGAAGVLVTIRNRPFGVMAFTVLGGRIAEMNGIVDPGRVAVIAARALARLKPQA